VNYALLSTSSNCPSASLPESSLASDLWFVQLLGFNGPTIDCKGSPSKKRFTYGHCTNWPPSILGSCKAFLCVNRAILQNTINQRETSFCWTLKIYKAFETKIRFLRKFLKEFQKHRVGVKAVWKKSKQKQIFFGWLTKCG
jgi:hypothetical protein